MKASELSSIEKTNHPKCCYQVSSGQHYKEDANNGIIFPSTKAQAKYYLSLERNERMYNSRDVEILEKLMNKHDLYGDYKYTKSKRWVRLQNHDDLRKALKLEYGL